MILLKNQKANKLLNDETQKFQKLEQIKQKKQQMGKDKKNRSAINKIGTKEAI